MIETEQWAEEWVAVEGFPGYSVSPHGQVRKDSTGRVLQTRLNQFGVPYVGLMREGQRHQSVRSLPRLVLSSYVPQPNDIFDTPINMNGDRTDCRVSNLVWRPRWYAVYYVNQFEDRYDNPIEAPIREVETGEEFPNSLAAGCRFGVLEREVVLSILNRTLAWPTFQQFELTE
jgi:hypothetical protein